MALPTSGSQTALALGGNEISDADMLRVQELCARAEVREAAASQLHLASLVDSSEDAIVSKSLDGEIVSWNHGAQELFGYTPEEAIGASIAMLVPPDRHDELHEIMTCVRRGTRLAPLETKRRTKDGSLIDVALRISVIYNTAGEPTGASSISRGISERVRMEAALREAERRFRTAFDRAPIGVCLLSLGSLHSGHLLDVNPALAEILGTSVQELTGAPLSSLTHPEDHAEIDAKIHELGGGHIGHIEFETRLMHSNGRHIWALINAAPLSDHEGEQTLAVTHIMDVSSRKVSEGKLQHLADHDPLTGLLNRRRFIEELERTLRHAKRYNEIGAVLFLDLDRFKLVNDTLGHAAGDELIGRVAELLRGAVRDADTLTRIGGDEFALLLTRCDEIGAVLVAKKLRATLRRQRVSCSIGIALFSGDAALSADELVVRADSAMYDAKDAGKGGYAVCDKRA